MAFLFNTCWSNACLLRQGPLVKRTVLALFFSILFFSTSFACVVSCRVSLNLSIGTDGFSVVTPNILLVDNTCNPAEFRVELLDPFGFNLGDTIWCSMVGQTLTAKVIKISNGNSCTTEITIFDNLNPVIACQDTTLKCGQDYSPATLGYPTVYDNCTALSIQDLSFVDIVSDYSCGFADNGDTLNALIERRWTAVDEFGNTGTCSQFIRLKKSYLSDVILPPNLDDTQLPAIDCNADPLDLNLTGFPNIDGLALNSTNFCDLAADFSDQPLNICGAGYLILRTWTLADWCTGDVNTHVQFIKVRDTLAPIMECPQDLTISTGVNTCTATVNLPTTTATDDCSTVTINPVWEFGTGYGPFVNIPLGVYPVTYTATDACGNNSTCVVMVTVADEIPPQNICKAFLQVGLNFDGMAYVPASSFDAGTYDNCILDELLVSRDGINYSSEVIFNCDDVENSPVLVTMRAIDFFGNFNECDVQVTVVDLLPPTITCPDSITLNCTEDYMNISITGSPNVYDNCSVDTMFFSDQISLNTCNVGEVIRTWVVRDLGGVEVQCQQIITLQDTTTLTIAFPGNYSTNVCNPDLSPEITGEPIVGNLDCEFLYIGFTDDTTYQAFPACFVVYRHWEIYEWCSHDPQTDEGYWEASQILQVVDDIDPILSVPNDTTVYLFDENCGAEFFSINHASASDCSESISITNNSIFASNYGANPSGNYPVGIHLIGFEAEDNCGNKSTDSFTLTVLDGKSPSPVCKSGLIINLDSNGSVTVDPAHINNGSFDNCTDSTMLVFDLIPNVFNCEDVGVNQVELIVYDEAGNAASCFTNITIQNNPGDCPSGTILGNVNIWSGSPVNAVEMELNGVQDMTNINGEFSFDNLSSGQNYVLEAFKDGNDEDGISVLDIVLLSRSLIGLTPLTNPYQILAGDVDRDNGLSVFDLILMQKLILRIDSIVPNSNSWRMIPDDFVFSNPNNPFLDFIPEYHEINNLGIGNTEKGFIGVKLGDISGNADPTLSMVSNELINTNSSEIEDGNKDNVELIRDDHIFKLRRPTRTFGFMFEIECEQYLENVSVYFAQNNLLTMDYYYNPENGLLRVVGFHHNSVLLDVSTELFKVEFDNQEIEVLSVKKSQMVDKHGNLLEIPVKVSNGY